MLSSYSQCQITAVSLPFFLSCLAKSLVSISGASTFLRKIIEIKMEKWKTSTWFILNVWKGLLFSPFRTVLNICFCTGHFVMVPLNLTCLHCLHHFCLRTSLKFILNPNPRINSPARNRSMIRPLGNVGIKKRMLQTR